MTFVGNVLHLANAGDNKIYKTFIATETVTTKPRGLAKSPSSATVGEALWVLVDGDPNDKILRLKTDDGTLQNDFNAPSSASDGITFLNNSLWVVATDGGQRKLFEVSPNNGQVLNTFSLTSVFSDLGGLTNDGTNLIAYSKNNTEIFTLSTTGSLEGTNFPFNPSLNFFGAKALAFSSDRSEFIFAEGSTSLGTVGIMDSNFDFVSQKNLIDDTSSNALKGIQALVFDSATLFIGHLDGTKGKISKTLLFDTATKTPRAMALTPSGTVVEGQLVDEALWIVVKGSPDDRLLKVAHQHR